MSAHCSVSSCVLARHISRTRTLAQVVSLSSHRHVHVHVSVSPRLALPFCVTHFLPHSFHFFPHLKFVDYNLLRTPHKEGMDLWNCLAVFGVDVSQLSGRQGRTRLVVLAAEVKGRWSQETAHFLLHMAKAKVRHEPKVMTVSDQCAWLRRWQRMLACSAAQAFALSLLCKDNTSQDFFRSVNLYQEFPYRSESE